MTKKTFEQFLAENIGVVATGTNAEISPLASDGSLEYDDIAMMNMDDPQVLNRLNAYLAQIGKRRYANPNIPIMRLRDKLTVIGLGFDPEEIESTDFDQYIFPMNRFGGVFDPMTGKNGTGLENIYPGGLFLVVDVDHDGDWGLKCKVVPGDDLDLNESYEIVEEEDTIQEDDLDEARINRGTRVIIRREGDPRYGEVGRVTSENLPDSKKPRQHHRVKFADGHTDYYSVDHLERHKKDLTESPEQIDELKKSTLLSYSQKAYRENEGISDKRKDLQKRSFNASKAAKNELEAEDDVLHRKAINRQAGMRKAAKRLGADD